MDVCWHDHLRRLKWEWYNYVYVGAATLWLGPVSWLLSFKICGTMISVLRFFQTICSDPGDADGLPARRRFSSSSLTSLMLLTNHWI